MPRSVIEALWLVLEIGVAIVGEAFQVGKMIERLPCSWNDFKNNLKHNHKEMKLEYLVIWLNNEEDNKTAEQKSCKSYTINGVSIIEEAPAEDKKREF